MKATDPNVHDPRSVEIRRVSASFARTPLVNETVKEPATKPVTEATLGRGALIGALLAVLCAPGAHAQADSRESFRVAAQQAYDRDDSPRRGRRGEQREQREQRRQPERQQRESLTPDERRELNRDLERANREIYRKGRGNR